MSSIAQRWMGRGNIVKMNYAPGEKLIGLIDVTRPILTFMGVLGVASGAALANRGFPNWSVSIAGLAAALLAYAGIHTFNDFVDTQRDAECWPGRPIPSQRITPRQALLLAISSLVASLIIIDLFFNPTCLIVSTIALVLGCLYSAYLRDRVGYLVLPPIQSLLWLCGWVAFSPETLFSAWLPWVLYLFSVAWQAGHIMVYSPLHPIRKFKGMNLTQVPAFFMLTSAEKAARLGFGFLTCALGLAIYLGVYANLGPIYLGVVVIMGIIMLVMCYQFTRRATNFGTGIRTFTFVTYFMLAARLSILLSIFLFY